MRKTTVSAGPVSYRVRWRYHCLSAEAAILGGRARHETETRVNDALLMRLRAEEFALRSPVERQAGIIYQPVGRELRRMPSVQDRRDDADIVIR